ncbi:hypothetical protein LINGRAHAP2_LOCUS2261 [Linum grandiflorum]
MMNHFLSFEAELNGLSSLLMELAHIISCIWWRSQKRRIWKSYLESCFERGEANIRFWRGRGLGIPWFI